MPLRIPLRPQKSVALEVTLQLTQKDQETPVKGSAAWLYPRLAKLTVRAVRSVNGWRLSASVTVTGAAVNAATVHEVWARGQALFVHGWIYRISDGLLHDMGLSIGSDAELRALEDR